MTPYFLLRNNKQSGPYSLEQLKSLDLRPTDLLWKEGENSTWRNPEELDELVPFLPDIEASDILPISKTDNVTTNPDLRENGMDVEVPVGKMKENTPGDEQSKEISATETSPGIPNPSQEEAGPVHSTAPIKVIIADDHSLFREGVKLVLSQKQDIEIIAEAETGVHLLNLLKHHKPDVLLLDIEMPVMDGITALKEIRKLYGNLKVIILSMHDAGSMVTTLMKTGANSYLTKSADSSTIYQAIKGVHTNEFHYTDLSSKSMIESLNETPRPVLKDRPGSESRGKSDVMLKMRDMNNRHNPRMPSRKRRKKSMLLLIASVLTAIGVLGMFYFNDQSPKNKIMYAGPLPDSTGTHTASSTITPQSQETVKSKVLNDLLREQDSIIQSRRFSIVSEPKDVVPQRKDVVSAQPVVRQRKKIPEAAKEIASDPEPEVVKEPQKEEVILVPPVDSPLIRDKGLARYQLRNLLSVEANNYDKGIFGGVSDIKLTVTNRSEYIVNDVTIQLEYLLSGKKVHRSTLLHVTDIAPSSSKVIAAPRNARGVAIQYWITSWSSKELE